MASLGHIAVGMAAARIYRHGQPTRWALFSSMVVWSALSMLPDADVLGFNFGIRYADPWGHRGASHSIAFALALALLIGAASPWLKLGARRTACLAAAVISSHPLLDTLTNGGLGCALFWPFTDQRYFAPWDPIPVAPIGRRFFSPAGLFVAITELVLFSPIIAYALWPRRRVAPSQDDG
jgi:inner membrane protein